MRIAPWFALVALAGCARLRRRAPRASDVDPRVTHATACIDPRYFASSRVPLPSRGPVVDVAVAGGRGARWVAWRDDEGAHRWDFAATHRLDPAVTDLCAWLASPGVRCATAIARGRGRSATLRVSQGAGGGDAALVAEVRAGGRTFERQQLSARFDPRERFGIAWDGGAFGAAWTEPVHGAPARAYFALIDRDGRRVGSAMRVQVEGTVGLRRVALAWAAPDYLLAALRDDGTAELRASGPRGCDEPLSAQPPAVPPPRR